MIENPGGTPTLDALKRLFKGVRQRLLWVLISFGVGAGLTWYFHTRIFLWMLAPAGDQLSPYGNPVFTGPTEMFSQTVGLAVKGGLFAAFPVAVYHAYRLLRPILSKKVRRFLRIFIPAGFVCYLCGVAFAYFVLLPTGLKFLLQFGTEVATPMVRITEYMALATAMIFWLGVVFELPLAMLLLAKLRIVSHKRFQKLRRYVPLAAFVLGAIITPSMDMVNQTLVAVPLILLYEVGIFLAWLVRPRAQKEVSP